MTDALPTPPSWTRRNAFAALAAGVATPAIAQAAMTEIGGYLIVAQWEAKEGQADAVADILRRYLPLAQKDSGVKHFSIGRAKDNSAQFLFYELFTDEAAYKAHQTRDYFQTLIAGQALALLSKRERTRFVLL
jgi:quinol monooxygenase YgiN